MPGNPYYRSKHWKALRARALQRDRNICTTPGCGERATIVDHKKTRPNTQQPTPFDVLDNLRSLCRRCDNQVKELGTKRRSQAQTRAVGCDADGIPRDPKHHWAS